MSNAIQSSIAVLIFLIMLGVFNHRKAGNSLGEQSTRIQPKTGNDTAIPFRGLLGLRVGWVARSVGDGQVWGNVPCSPPSLKLDHIVA